MSDRAPSSPQTFELTRWSGTSAEPGARADVVLEVAHGATRAADYARTRNELRGEYPDDLRDFFFVNTDVGAPELAQAVARQATEADPHLVAVVVRCLLPRTFIDCNRRIDFGELGGAAPPGGMTPGLPPWVRHSGDRAHLRAGYEAYQRELVDVLDAVCGAGGLGLFVHTYAPRSIDVDVDEDIVRRLRAEYEPSRLESWPLRSPVDLITRDPGGRELASPELAEAAEREFRAAGFEVARNGVYSLHPSTMAFEHASRHARRTLCLEVRRDLLVGEFTPFAEMTPDEALVARAAAPLARALLEALARR